MLNALVCYNPLSGKQKVGKKLEYIKEILGTKYSVVDVYATTGIGSLTEHLKMHGNEYDLIIVSGGDGTFNEAVTGLIDGNCHSSLAYIPGGTCNDVGTMLKLPRNIKKAMKMILENDAVGMDIGKADNKYFSYVFGVGKFIDISYVTPSRLKRRFGRLAYFFYGVKELAKRINVDITLTNEKGVFKSSCYVLLGLNSNHLAGFKIFRKNKIKLNDGIMDITLIERRAFSFYHLCRFVIFGDLALKRGIKNTRITSATLSFSEPLSCNTDGEFAFQKKSVDIQMLKEAINIIVPAKTKKRYF